MKTINTYSLKCIYLSLEKQRDLLEIKLKQAKLINDDIEENYCNGGIDSLNLTLGKLKLFFDNNHIKTIEDAINQTTYKKDH